MVSVATESKLKLNQKMHWFNCLPTHPSTALPHPHMPSLLLIFAILSSLISYLLLFSLIISSHCCTWSASLLYLPNFILSRSWLSHKQLDVSLSLMLLCQQPLLLHSLWRSYLIPLLAVPLFPLFLLWMELPMSYFCFSSSIFQTYISLPSLLKIPQALVLFSIIFRSLSTSSTSASEIHPITHFFWDFQFFFSAWRKIVSCDISLRFLLFYSDRTLTLVALYIAVSCPLSFLIKTTEQVCDLNYLWSELSVPEETLGCSGGTFCLCTQQSSLPFSPLSPINAFLSPFFQHSKKCIYVFFSHHV